MVLREPCTRVVARTDWLDLDYVRAEFAQGLSTQRTRQDFTQVKDAYAFEGSHVLPKR
jgi:hypothetical protein